MKATAVAKEFGALLANRPIVLRDIAETTIALSAWHAQVSGTPVRRGDKSDMLTDARAPATTHARPWGNLRQVG